ncbi:hypothetical protein L7F22_061881 [Adiantum nelumboides]|nr:hypothetical protein [Adiantum nelumboides]
MDEWRSEFAFWATEEEERLEALKAIIGELTDTATGIQTQAQYIIVATYYLTEWAEAKATRKNDAQTTAAFLYENVFTRYELQIEIISNRGTHFLNEVTEYLLSEFMVIHYKSAPYHPQANGQAEHTNKILSSILTKVVSTGRTDWEMNLHAALGAYRVSFKTALNATPFNLVYGLDAILPIEFLLSTLRVARDLEWKGHELSEQLEDLENLDEQRLTVVAHIYAQKRKRKQFFDSHLLTQILKKGDLVLVYSLKQHIPKFKKKGNIPFVIEDVFPSGDVKLSTLDGEPMANWISGCRLKKTDTATGIQTQAQYIIVATYYLTEWAEAKATRKNDAQTTAAFLYENVFTRYGLPIEIISDRGTHFLNEVIEYLLSEFMVIHNKSAPYHPQANGQAEHTNKILSSILTKVVSTGRTDWEMNLHATLWAYRVSSKTALNATPFNLVYGLDAILPIEFLLSTLRVARDLEWKGHELSEQLEDLENLDEQRLTVVAHIYAQKRKRKQFFDSHLLTQILKRGDLVLVYSLKQHIPKFKKKGNSPFVIEDVFPSGAVKLSTLDGEPMANWISGCRLKKYHLPLTHELLERMHAAKQRKIKRQQIIDEAQEEAKIRVLKRKAALKNHQFAIPMNNLMTEKQLKVPSTDAVSTDDEWQDGMDLQITVNMKNHNINALVDTGARMNAVNYSTYKKATDQPLQPGVKAIKGCNKEMTPALGLINFNVLVNGFPCPH